ncbi:multicomponent Na+:H+ antiporter subunit F [Kineococcus xinjiangensis]|uniref:Multicomponent Na+:H+ antiporter subunit F n=1 Tax=Kineococcus xinjiangensis TaxID=512762 RepID=A0A2S6IGT8_9ACTN|nr:monovalent cation/H+ antiporter complex subunit F [Kineococcus xinjiangensis]PPK93411.1 multicomponent Na+:H+ antiporter subunit F [Kineococcus xinjiangensis]
MIFVYAVCLAGLALAGAMVAVRLLQGPRASDRVVALDTLLLVAVGLVAVQVARSDEEGYVGILVVVSLLAFAGTVTAARFLERREEP